MHQRKKKNFSYQTKCTSRKQTKTFIVQISEYPFQVLHLQKALVPEDDQGIKRVRERVSPDETAKKVKNNKRHRLDGTHQKLGEYIYLDTEV